MKRPLVAIAIATTICGCSPTDYESCIDSKVMSARTETAAQVARNLCDEKFLAPARAAAEAKRQAEYSGRHGLIPLEPESRPSQPNQNPFDRFDNAPNR